MTLERGERVGAWELIEPIGEGGMGEVWRARGSSEEGAVKVLGRELVGVAELEERFVREALALRTVQHENVVRCLDAGVEGGRPYVVMELLAGESLESRLAKLGRLSPEELLAVAKQAARGLAAAHAAGIIHRDVTPMNLFLCNDGITKIIDFGLAKWHAIDLDISSLTTPGRPMGTPAYMAPEQATSLHEPDGRTDVWGLAATLYDALTGSPPFGGGDVTLIALIGRILAEPPAPLPMDVPASLGAVIERALRKDPDERYPTMAAFAAALERCGLAPGESPPESRVPESLRLMSVLIAETHDAAAAAEVVTAVRAENGEAHVLPNQIVMGIFGGSAWLGDEPERAARAALAAQCHARAVGVGTGRGSWPSAEGRLTGQVVADAMAALREAMQTGGTRVCEETGERLAGRFAFEPGRRLTAEREAASPLKLASVRGAHVAIVGRKAELRDIAAALTTAVGTERSAVIFIEGEPGIGKSRMLVETRAWADRRLGETRYLEVRADPSRRLGALSLLCTIIGGRPGRAVDAVQAGLMLADGDMRPFLNEVLGADDDDPRLVAARGDRGLMREGVQKALCALLSARCADSPVVMLIDDIDHADEASLDILDALIGKLSRSPLVVVATARSADGVARRRPRLSAARRVELGPLDEGAIEVIVHKLIGRAAPEIAARAGGNPFFVEELALAEGRATATKVEAALAARLEGLPADERELLSCAAVVGATFSTDALEAMGVTNAAERLGPVARQGLVAPVSAPTQWRFRHGLVQAVAYGLVNPRRAHARAAAWLSEEPHTPAEVLARHWQAAGEIDQAAEHWCRAAELATRHAAFSTVREIVHRALGHGAVSPELHDRLNALHAEAAQ